MTRTAASLATFAFLLSGCAGAAFWRAREVEPPVELPSEYRSKAVTATIQVSPERWWTSFDDAALDDLMARAFMARAFEDNLELREAWARLDQAVAVARRSGAGRWPEVDAEGNASRRQSLFFAGEELGGVREFVAEQFELAAAASWEVDVWKRVAALAEADEAAGEAARHDVDGTALTVAAELADTWYGLVESRARLDLLERQLRASRGLQELVELRFATGLATAVDVYEQLQLVSSVRAEIPPLRAEIESLENRLALLAGRPPGGLELPVRSDLPELPPLPDTGVPAQLLKRRPDVRAAELRVASANYRVWAAVADRFPALRLTGRVGYQSFEPTAIFESWIYSLAGNAILPLLDAGRRRAEVGRAEALARERLLAYGRTVLQAIEEVENTLVREARQRERVAELQTRVEILETTLREAKSRYRNGLSDYLPVLQALDTLNRTEREELAARGELVSTRIRLCRALGGDWTDEVASPEPLPLSFEKGSS